MRAYARRRVRALGVEIAPEGHSPARTATHMATSAGEEADAEVKGDCAHIPNLVGKQERQA
jgi:hypothetical protein